jgi:hypothetical protein
MAVVSKPRRWSTHIDVRAEAGWRRLRALAEAGPRSFPSLWTSSSEAPLPRSRSYISAICQKWICWYCRLNNTLWYLQNPESLCVNLNTSSRSYISAICQNFHTIYAFSFVIFPFSFSTGWLSWSSPPRFVTSVADIMDYLLPRNTRVYIFGRWFIFSTSFPVVFYFLWCFRIRGCHVHARGKSPCVNFFPKPLWKSNNPKVHIEQ